MRLLPFLLCLSVHLAFSQSYTVDTPSPLLADLTEMLGGDLVEVRLLLTDASRSDTFDLYLLDNASQGEPTHALVIDEKALWLSLNASIAVAEKIAKALGELDSLNAERYRFNADVYREQLLDLEQNIQEQVDARSTTQRLLVSASEEVKDFAEHFGLVYATATAQTDLDELLCRKLADCPAVNHYELLEYNTEVIIGYLQENPAENTRNPTGWNNYWLLGGLVLLGAGLGLFAFLRKQ